MIDASTGEQKRCNAIGNLIKPFDPKITGRFNYDMRQKKMIETGADLAPVELPAALGTRAFRNLYMP